MTRVLTSVVVAGVMLVALALRLGAAEASFPTVPVGDERYYLGTAVNIATGAGHVGPKQAQRASWPPGQSFFLSLFVSPDTEWGERTSRRVLRPLVVTQVALGTLLVGLTALLAHALFGPSVAVLAASMAALYPTLIAFSHYLWSETLFAVLLTAALVGVVRGARGSGPGGAVATGALFGAASLTREVAIPLAFVCALWWVWGAPSGSRRPAARRAALMLGVAALVVIPWTVRNHAELDRFVPVSTAGWMGLHEGNHFGDAGWLRPDHAQLREDRRAHWAIRDEAERMDVARAAALRLIRAEQPTWIVKKAVRNVALLLQPESALFVKLRKGAYGPLDRATERAILLATIASYVLLVVAGITGIAGAREVRLPLLLLGAVVALHVVANANSRYRLPLVPLLIAYASHAVLDWRDVRARLTRRRVAAAATALLVFLGWCVPYYQPVAAMHWSGRADPGDLPRPGRIILFSMDTVRADHVDGGIETSTPVLDGIADEGVVFPGFHAASSYTVPSHMSIFTGLDPLEHGVTRNDTRLSPDVPTLAEILALAGYRTAAFHEGVFVAARFGFGRGFESYRRHPRVDVVRRGLPAVLAWIRNHAGEPYFLFLHTYAAHFPYGGYSRYRDGSPERGLPDDATLEALRAAYPFDRRGRRAAAADLPPETRALCTLHNQLAPGRADLLGCGDYRPGSGFAGSEHFESDVAAIRASYAERIALVDRALGRVRDTLEGLSQWDDTLLVVTSDHGEAFYEHGHYQHDFVPFEEVLRAPLVVSLPRLLRDGPVRAVDGLAWHLDLLPTILGLAGVPAPVGLGGRDLGPALRGVESLPEDRAIFPAVLRPAHLAQEPARRAVLRGDLKYIEGHPDFGDEHGLLFDLAADPDERTNLRSRRADDARGLARALGRYAEGLTARAPIHQETRQPLDATAGGAVDLSDEERRALRELGYAP